MTRGSKLEIAVLGALDRYNYGDLLFPLVLKEYLQKSDEIEINHYGLIAADLEKYGSVRTRPFCEFYDKYKSSSDRNIVIIAGGCVIGSHASRLYCFLKETRMPTVFSSICKLLHLPDPISYIARKKLNIGWGEFPFCPPKINDQTLLIYNAVGDKFKSHPKLIANLKDADYLSVRNARLFDALNQIMDTSKLALCPDSATVMSQLWPRETLKKMVSAEAGQILDSYKNGYIAFQAKISAKRRIDKVRQQLNQLHSETKLPILMVPIGRAHRHGDHVLLEELANTLDAPSRLADVANLHDVMCLIACSSLFIGTSLHGNITAMSYAIPHLGIGNIPKLDQYLKYWDVEPNKLTGTVKLSQICNGALNVLRNSDTEKLSENAEKLSFLADKNLKIISKIVNEYCGIKPA